MATKDYDRNRVKSKRVYPVRLEMECAVVGCAGRMESTGTGFTQIDTAWEHRCSVCGIRECFINERYPRIEHIESRGE